MPTALVKLDIDTGEPVRDANGRCVRCFANEAGEAIGQIPDAGSHVSGRFEGYTNAQETEKKVLRHVIEADDAWFRTGDLMRKDERGFFYFVDRVGDTFRWKGENVATSEVSQVLTEYPGVVEANVYGVAIPGTDGRAGMAAIVADEKLNLADFRAHLNKRLPGYARPLFLRIRREMDVTPTFKHKKSDLARDGFDPSLTADSLYFNDASRGAFVRLDDALYAEIQSGAGEGLSFLQAKSAEVELRATEIFGPASGASFLPLAHFLHPTALAALGGHPSPFGRGTGLRRAAGVDCHHGPGDALRALSPSRNSTASATSCDAGQTAQRAAPGDLVALLAFARPGSCRCRQIPARPR